MLSAGKSSSSRLLPSPGAPDCAQRGVSPLMGTHARAPAPARRRGPAFLTFPALNFCQAFIPPSRWRDAPSLTRTDINYSARPAEPTVHLPSRRQFILCLPSGLAFPVRRKDYNTRVGLSTSETADFLDPLLASKSAVRMRWRRRGPDRGGSPPRSGRHRRRAFWWRVWLVRAAMAGIRGIGVHVTIALKSLHWRH